MTTCTHLEVGYDLTMVKNAIAHYSYEEAHAALEVNTPNYDSPL
jgi:hypothetical protein